MRPPTSTPKPFGCLRQTLTLGPRAAGFTHVLHGVRAAPLLYEDKTMAITATETVLERLRQRAKEVSHPFCYNDYIKVEQDQDGAYRCPKCGSDDLMREVDGVGCEYGYDWIMEHLVETEGEEIDIDELYREVLDELYTPIQFGNLEYSPSAVLEAVDPVAFQMGVQENADSEIQDAWLIELNGKCYRLEDITD